MGAVKVDLIQERVNPWATGTKGRPVSRMAPFLMKSTGRVHRVRSARIYAHGPDLLPCWGGRQYHVGVSLWCGGSGFLDGPTFSGPPRQRRDLLLHEPPDGSIICGTCEGRAVGAGQQSAAWLTAPDRPLIFTPRRA